MTNKTEDYAKKPLDRFEKDAFPWLGKLPITSIEAADVLAVVKRIEQRGANEIAAKAKRSIGQVFAMP